MARKPKWTEAELKEFDRITFAESSTNQLTRIMARLELRKFVDKHGKEKCDAMFAVIKKRDAKK